MAEATDLISVKRISGRAVFKCIEEAASMGACEQKRSVSMRLLPTEMSNKLIECGNCWRRRGPDLLLSADISASKIK